MKDQLKYIIIVAGGKGMRFGADLPKQFILLKGVPILMRTIRRFHNAEPEAKIILVLPDSQISYWNELCEKFKFEINVTVARGGDTRFQSVKNGLSEIPEKSGLVSIHDGVRPLVSEQLIKNGFCSAAEFGSAIPVIQVTDSIRMINNGDTSTALNRNSLRAVQTPQVFNLKNLIEAYNIDFSSLFTDDASVYEAAGMSITLIDGDVNNIKITHQVDVKIAEYILDNE